MSFDDMAYPTININCDNQEQADKLIRIFNDLSDEFSGQRVSRETKYQIQDRLRHIQDQLDSDDFYNGASFELEGGTAYNEDLWYIKDILAYHKVFCKENKTPDKPNYVQVNNMLFDLKSHGILQSYTQVIPCLNTILPRYEKPYPKDKTINVEVRYDAQDKIENGGIF